jgi:hypothetical protein
MVTGFRRDLEQVGGYFYFFLGFFIEDKKEKDKGRLRDCGSKGIIF